MIKHIFLFFGTFVLGAVLSLAARTALYQPQAGPDAAAGVPEYVAMVDNAPPPAAKATLPPPAEPTAGQPAVPGGTKPVNTVCAICGMDVDPEIPTATYQGKIIGFGCNACPKKFAANPDRYGPYALRNEIAPK